MSSTDEKNREPGGKRERTRAALIAATLEVVAAKGFAGASLDEIAARAGMTKGAIYSNFAGKAELLIAAMGTKGLALPLTLPPDAPLREQLTAAAAGLAAAIHRAREEVKFVAEFQLYALGDPELRSRVAASYAGLFAAITERLSHVKDVKLTMPPRRLAVALQSIALGFLFQSLITPEDVTEEVIIEALTALTDGLIEPA
jgi:AcrR family transcriptional regulator